MGRKLVGYDKSNGFGLVIFGVIASIVLLTFSPTQSFAQQTDANFTVVAGDDLKKNPTAIQILKNIEIAKQRLAEMQNGQIQKTAQQKFIDEQRKLAQAALEKDLARMNNEYVDFTPSNSFSRFVSGLNATHQAFYWDQFNYMNEKLKIANQAKQTIIQNGGSYAQAQAEFVKYASMQRTEMIEFVTDLNIKYGFTDEGLQSYFDENGKLPRYNDNEDYVPVCYGCDKYEQVRDKMLAEHELEKTSKSS